MNYSLNTFKNRLNIKSLTFLLLACLLLSANTYSQDLAMNDDVGISTNEVVGVLAFDLNVIDYGTITQNDNGVRIFKFTNRGRAPIVITDVKTSCGCTIPKFSKNQILPGETGEIEIKYDTKRLGAFTKTITVMSNAYESKKILKIKGNIIKKA